ncbi:pca operon transcription factor PcaQ, partial [Pseudomonas syringae]
VVGRGTAGPRLQGMRVEHRYHESVPRVRRSEHPWLAAPLKPEGLEPFPLVLPLAGTAIRKVADSLFVQCGIRMPRQRHETLSLTLSRRYVQCSDAMWIEPLATVSLELKDGSLEELNIGIRHPCGAECWYRNQARPIASAAQ